MAAWAHDSQPGAGSDREPGCRCGGSEWVAVIQGARIGCVSAGAGGFEQQIGNRDRKLAIAGSIADQRDSWPRWFRSDAKYKHPSGCSGGPEYSCGPGCTQVVLNKIEWTQTDSIFGC